MFLYYFNIIGFSLSRDIVTKTPDHTRGSAINNENFSDELVK